MFHTPAGTMKDQRRRAGVFDLRLYQGQPTVANTHAGLSIGVTWHIERRKV
jgi:hypothetical protein